MPITIPSRLSDAELVAEVTRCARDERSATAHLVAHLAEFDARRLHLAAGFSSLFAYCCEVLGLSEHGTYNHIEAARAAQRFPSILDRLHSGTLNLTAVRLLAPHLTEANHQELLGAAARCSKREVEELLARRHPRPDVPFSVRKVPQRSVPNPILATMRTPAPFVIEEPRSVAPPGDDSVVPPSERRRSLVAPLSASRYEIRFTATAATQEKLKVVRDLLGHAMPGADLGEIFDRALTALMDELSRKKLAIVQKMSCAQWA